MGATTRIGWTDGTVNFWIGCTRVGPGCERCYAAALARRRWGIEYVVGGERRPVKAGFHNPLRWQAAHEAMETHIALGGEQVPVPLWVFTLSLGDFFDNEIPAELRARAWAIVKKCNRLRWQIVTKRVGLVERMLPADWNGGRGYEHVGVVATVVDQNEMDRDGPKLESLYALGVKWTGLSIEPQLGPVRVHINTDWMITGGESTQDGKVGRPYDLAWAHALVRAGRRSGTPVFVKQLGAQPVAAGVPLYGGGRQGKHDNPERWPDEIRVQQLPRIYDRPSPRGGAAQPQERQT